ncbi:sugar ABC transporter substrate-binding protein [Pseudaminobacter sp. 19-2017]|uniref:Sugar ABC transporter substrate-binding protein n=1 Tax=Pseudaminobacter soli (ex Zhang et al. 2022) TaxID=2831468 RepID=A0A942E767_9HYPH|nr:sugar ABC transporter substrate-binding protein [Pseudaminobacter soli]MBS3652388.1 sugar ABC transporter substrate-binding protein [Pseudaminobacter soli]
MAGEFRINRRSLLAGSAAAAAMLSFAPGALAQGKKLKIGFALSGVTTNAIFIDMARDLERRTQAAGYSLLTTDIAEGPQKIVSALENFINAGADVIIFQNYAEEATADLMQQAIDRGVIIGSYDTDSKIAQYSTMASNYELGKVIGQETGKWVSAHKGSKNVAMCTYSKLDFLVERARGMVDGLRETAPDAVVATQLDAGFPHEGVPAGENFLQAVPDLQAVMGINDGGTLGVYQAFKAAGLNKDKGGPVIFGCDASLDGLKAVKENDLFVATVDLDLVNQVGQLYERCVEAALSGTLDESKKLVIYPIKPVYADTVDTYL